MAVAVEAGLVVPAFVLGYFLKIRPFSGIDLSAREIARGILATGPMLGFFWWLLKTNYRPLARIRDFLDRVIYPLLGQWNPWALFTISVCAGVGEEALFREVIQGASVKYLGAGGGIFLASVLFGLAHLITPTYAVITTIIGIYLGLWFHFTGNLLVPIVIHAFYDFVALLILVRRKKVSKLLTGDTGEDSRLSGAGH